MGAPSFEQQQIQYQEVIPHVVEGIKAIKGKEPVQTKEDLMTQKGSEYFDYPGPERRKSERRKMGSVESRLIELEIKLEVLSETSTRHSRDIKDALERISHKYDKILLGDGITTKGIVHEIEAIDSLKELFDGHVASDERNFSIIKWAIVLIVGINIIELVALVRMIFQ